MENVNKISVILLIRCNKLRCFFCLYTFHFPPNFEIGTTDACASLLENVWEQTVVNFLLYYWYSDD